MWFNINRIFFRPVPVHPDPEIRIFGFSDFQTLEEAFTRAKNRFKIFLTPNSLITIPNPPKSTIKTEKLNVGFLACGTHFLLLVHPFWLLWYRPPWWLYHGILVVFVLCAPLLGGGYWQTLQRIPWYNFGVEVWTPLQCLYYLPLFGRAGTGKHCMVPCLNTNFC